jgi:hypothetical protein
MVVVNAHPAEQINRAKSVRNLIILNAAELLQRWERVLMAEEALLSHVAQCERMNSLKNRKRGPNKLTL